MNDDRISQLGGVAKDKYAHPFTVVRWVAENIGTEWSDIDATSIPDPGAVGLLEFAKSNPDDFRRLYYARLPEHASVTPHPWGDDRGPDSLWAIWERRIRDCAW